MPRLWSSSKSAASAFPRSRSVRFLRSSANWAIPDSQARRGRSGSADQPRDHACPWRFADLRSVPAGGHKRSVPPCRVPEIDIPLAVFSYFHKDILPDSLLSPSWMS
jgi:hypothetical protein